MVELTYGLPDVMSPIDAAEFLKLNIKTVYDSMKEKGGIPGRKIRGRYRILRDEFLGWLRKNDVRNGR